MNSQELHRRVSAELQRTALMIVLDRGIVSADDVRAAVTIPDGIDPRIVGAAFLRLKLDDFLEETGNHRTGRAVAHRRTVRDWRLKADRQATKSFLARLPLAERVTQKQRGLFDSLDEPE